MSDIYLSLTESPTVVTLSQPVVSGVLSSNVTVTNVVSVNVVTMPAINVTAAAPSVTTVAGTVAVSNFPSVTTVAGTVALDSASLIALENVTVTVGAAVTVAGFSTSSLPPSTVTVGNTVTINGTVTANGFDFNNSTYNPIPLAPFDETVGGGKAVVAKIIDDGGIGLNFSAGVPISGTVTVGASSVTFNSNVAKRPDGSWQPLYVENGSGYVGARVYSSDLDPLRATVTVGNSVTIGSLPAISGTVTANVGGLIEMGFDAGNNPYQTGVPQLGFSWDSDKLKPINVDDNGQLKVAPISGTVTANSIFPRVTLIDGSGTVATANTAITVFASSSTRSYLLVQVTTGSAFVNVGATATTVNGINLTAGQGYSWETTIPQGIVSLISTTTSSRYVAKEA